MPIDRYKTEDPFENHPLFKTEEQARLEETMDGVEPEFVSGGRVGAAVARRRDRGERRAGDCEIEDSGFWAVDRARDFDWGD